MTIPNMTTQIDYFQQLLEEKHYTKDALDSSVALVSLAGNDYVAYIFTNGSPKDMSEFSKAIIKQLAMNLKRIYSLGVQKVGVIGLEPASCLPVNSNQTCSETWNRGSKFHNRNLKQAVKILNNEII
ncbi:hypothetical protein Patl1_05913 [Pistacia atlantica]|uniref:Uncharacterized protein n=1 Tax=Pistacia atlantica TaxID=434234 RepID=A0ACC1BRJ6_9ROSI|nr:hypothetical protein Patl1_05913 [Pistacia atlantica]